MTRDAYAFPVASPAGRTDTSAACSPHAILFAGDLAALAVLLAMFRLLQSGTADAGLSLVMRLPWTSIAVVGALFGLTAIHYASGAIALQAVSDRRTTFRPALLVQFAAAAGNRIVPGGVGAASVNLRYLMRGGMTAGAAASSLTVLALVGGTTDVAYGAVVAAIGPSLGLHGATTQMNTLVSHGMHTGQTHSAIFLGVAAVALAGLLIRYRGIRSSLRASLKQAIDHGEQLARHWSHVLSATLASAMTTVLMSAGFVVAVRQWGAAAHPLPVGALIAVYLCASKASEALPLPPVCGMAEIALIGALVLGGYTSSSATEAVVIFRLIAYWLPLPIGIWAARGLRQGQLL